MVGIACGMWLLWVGGGQPLRFLRPAAGGSLGPGQVVRFALVLAMFLAFDLLTFFTKVTCLHDLFV